MLFVKKLDPRAIAPTCSHPGEDLGYDLYSLEDVTLKPFVLTKVRTGVAVEHKDPPFNEGLLIRDRSSMASKGIMTSGGVVDAGYRGEIIVLLTLMHENKVSIELLTYGSANYHYENVSTPIEIKAGDKIAQMIPIPVLTGFSVVEVDEMYASDRGANGFGSTGR